MRNRSGKSLIELLVVITALSAVLLVGGRLLVLLVRADASGAASLAAGQSLSRLASQFRRDAHASLQAELIDADAEDTSPPRLVFTLSDDLSVAYSAAADHVARVELRDGEPQARETYRLPVGDNRFELDSGMAALVHGRRVSEPTSRPASALPAREFRIEARRGRDARYVDGR